jgi:glycosyltransferase involved in cell wall biosynthesis
MGDHTLTKAIVKSVTMISWELYPLHTLGGTAYAIRRLADQLTEMEIKTQVLLPDCVETALGKDLSPLLIPRLLKMREEQLRAPRVRQCSEFSRVALKELERIGANGGSDAVIAHSLEGAISIVLRNGDRSGGPSVFWLHSLYDPSITNLSKEQRRLLPSGSLLSSAVMMADIVVTSTGILQDAREFEWPERLRELQRALMVAAAEDRVLTVESMGCLPVDNNDSPDEMVPGANLEKLKSVPSPYVLFPARPTLDKGLGFFVAIAERLRADNIACVAVQRPAPSGKPVTPCRNAAIYWLPWLTQDELVIAKRNAACTVLPSITEGFGLAAAESISQGVATLYQQVGGHHGLEEFPNALPVSLTANERRQLYGLWSELIEFHDSWPVWKRYETSLRPLIDRWVEAIRSVVYRAKSDTRGIENTDFPAVPVEDRWANRLCRRIEVGKDFETEKPTPRSIEVTRLWRRDGRPRLVHLMPWDLTVGGAQRMLDVWCSHEAQRWDTHILTPGARGPFEFAGATVHCELERSQVLSLIESLQPGLLVHHEPSAENGINSKCPQVWILHCTNSLREPPPKHVIPATVFSNFDSPEIHSDWRQLPLKVLPLQIDAREFHPAKRKHVGLVCGIVGRLHEDKVPPSFIDAVLAWQAGPWQIRFIGHGLDTGYQKSVKTKLANVSWVDVLGDVTPHEMPSALHGLDAVLIPTDSAQGETGSYTALEAMATGLPVIARDLPGLRYNCGSAPLYARHDTELLVLLRSLDDAGKRLELGARVRKAVVKKHDVRKHAADHSASFSKSLHCEISILMPVFDTPPAYLAECWESIRAQTFREWELVLVDDGSTASQTIAEIDRIARDPRVVLIRLDENQGIASALNTGLAQCRGKLVARMDADDMMMATRLERQFAYLQAHPDVAVLGTQLQGIEWKTEELHPPTEHPEQVTDEYIRHQRDTSEIWFLNHPTAMLRRSDVVNLGGYPSYRVAQDLGLWLKVMKAGLKIHNLPTVELHYRLHPRQVTRARGVRLEEYAQIVEECWTQQAAV